MIWDCFLFFNELDLLDLRLHVHGPFVDRFVLVESTHTFRGNPKPLYYHENRHLFEEFNGRIMYACVGGPEWVGRNPWANEEEQRNAIKYGLNCVPEDSDIMCLSDVDEMIDFTKFTVAKGEYLGLWMPLYYYHLNTLLEGAEWSANAFTMDRLQQDNGDLNRIRHNDRNRRIVYNAGWHFTFMGGPERVRSKVQSFSHSEFDRPDVTDLDGIKQRMNDGIDPLKRADPFKLKKVPITEETHPKYLVENQEKYKHLILK